MITLIKNHQKLMQKKDLPVNSSMAQYLTFVASTGWEEQNVEIRYENENIWLTQKMMAELYDVSVSAINQHIKTLMSDGEIENSTIKKYLIIQNNFKIH